MAKIRNPGAGCNIVRFLFYSCHAINCLLMARCCNCRDANGPDWNEFIATGYHTKNSFYKEIPQKSNNSRMVPDKTGDYRTRVGKKG